MISEHLSDYVATRCRLTLRPITIARVTHGVPRWDSNPRLLGKPKCANRRTARPLSWVSKADIPRVNISCVIEFAFSSAFVVRYAVFDSVICQRHYIDPNTSFVTPYSTRSSVTSLHRSQHVAPTLFVTMSSVFLKSTMRPFGIGQTTVLQNQQYHVEHIGMGLLNLVKQDDRCRETHAPETFLG